MVNRPMSRIRGQVVEVRAGQKLTSGGSSDSDANVWQVKPIGPSGAIAVITVTPVPKLRSTSFIIRGVTAPSAARPVRRGAASLIDSLTPPTVARRLGDPVVPDSRSRSRPPR